MKHFFLYAITLLSLFSCTAETVTPEPPPCNIGYFKRDNANNLRFVRTTEADTIHVIWYDTPYGDVPITWISTEIEWACIGFSDTDLSITLMTRTDTCYFFIPKDH